jgi:hypothetical protein
MSRPRRVRFWVALLTLALVALLRPLAQASPGDPVWIAGFYDGADFDDVVSLLITYGDADSPRPAMHRPAPPMPEALVETRDRSTGTADRPFTPTRAPPPSFAPPV